MASSIDYTQFHEVFQPDRESLYSQDLIREIESYRKSFNGVLFIDRVLQAMNVASSTAKVYPPRGENGLHQLHQTVCQTKMSTHQKLSVLYYLLLDHDDIHGVRSQRAEQFAEKTAVPKKYQIFMKGLWHMDRQQFPLAVEYLTHPSLHPEFADDIIAILVRHAQSNDYHLALAYFHTVQPVLKTSDTLELLFGALSRTSISEAFWFSRAQPQQARRGMFQLLVASVHHDDAPQPRAERTKALVCLPLDEDEEGWLDEYLMVGEGRMLKGARDTWAMRRVATNRYHEIRDEKLRAHLDTFGRPQLL